MATVNTMCFLRIRALAHKMPDQSSDWGIEWHDGGSGDNKENGERALCKCAVGAE